MASSLTPDITFRVRPVDYPQAIATDGQRWEDSHSARRPVWAGRPVWQLTKGTAERTQWRIFAYAGERAYEERRQEATSSLVVELSGGCAFRSAREMEDVACQRIAAVNGRALTPDEHFRVIDACRELWQIASPREVATFEVTGAGRTALALAAALDAAALDAAEATDATEATDPHTASQGVAR